VDGRALSARCHYLPIPHLILLNGPPGIGKSTLANRLASDHPLTLVLDIDSIRTSMGAWETHDESKLLARLIAMEMARAHLRSGHDVVVPQLLGRLEFIEKLAALAAERGATFHEILVLASNAGAYARLQARRAEIDRVGIPHPLRMATLDVDQLDATIRALHSIAAARPATRILQTKTGDIEGAYRSLSETLAETTST
jgi:predicted kinase